MEEQRSRASEPAQLGGSEQGPGDSDGVHGIGPGASASGPISREHDVCSVLHHLTTRQRVGGCLPQSHPREPGHWGHAAAGLAATRHAAWLCPAGQVNSAVCCKAHGATFMYQ